MHSGPSLKDLQGVAHDVAHHAQSSLACLYPHLGRACQEAGLRNASVSLLQDDPYPSTLVRHEPLALAIGSLRRRFFEILASYGYVPSDVASVELSFTFPPSQGDGSIYAVQAIIKTPDGRIYERLL
jgi:hypothetical protein